MCAIKKVTFGSTPASMLKGLNFNNNTVPNNGQPSYPIVSNEAKDRKKLKNITYISSALALTSLGIAGFAVHKNFKAAKNLTSSISELSKTLTGMTDDISKVTDKITSVENKTENMVQNALKHIYNLEGNTNNAVNSINYRIDSLPKPNFEVPGIYQTRKVNVFGVEMNLGTIVSEITGKVEEEMRNLLRTESTKRIFGLIERNNKPPRYSIVRMPSAELVPFTKTGGLAVVPKDLASNLAAVMEGKTQNGAMILDTPLYTGQIAADNFLSKVSKISPETGKFEGQFEYIKTFLTKDGWQKEKIATLNKVQEMSIPIHTEKGIQKENVNVYITDIMQAPVDWNRLHSRLSQETKTQIDIAIKKDGFYETDFVKIIKNQDTNQIEAFGKYRTTFYDSPKFDLSARKLNEGEKFNLYRNDALSSGETERMTYFSKFFTEQLYNSEQSSFVLKTLDKLDDKGNVIINKATGKPEQEYIKLGADAIIGNDWHTGPISAILRQLTTVKKFYGMEPQKADKLQNLPILTILHNVEYKGSISFSQERMFNIMFGEHAAKIVENAHMPDIAVIKDKQGLPQHLWNAMMTGSEVNPQMMAASYSDILIPVSEKYSEEIASHSGFGSSVHDIFKMRARKFEFENLDYIKSIVLRNGLDTKKVTNKKTLLGINNGCDTSNNTLTKQVADKMVSDLGLEKDAIIPFSEKVNILEWHNKNKGVYLDKIKQEIETAKNSAGADNPIKLYMPEATDLTGVDINTPIIAIAGRVEDQKGIDIYAKGILEFYKNYKGTNPPVFYIQGIGTDPKYMGYFLDGKTELAKTNPLAAKRLVATGLFYEDSRFNGCKMMTDFVPMPSWFEPFGLVHKENAKFNGAIPITNEVGGLTANLEDGINALFVKFQHRFDPNIDAVKINGENLGKIFEKAIDIYNDKPKFAQMLKASIEADHGWLVKDGPIDKYIKVLQDLNVWAA